MQILSKQRLDEIMSVFKFFGFIANNHRFPRRISRQGKTPTRLVCIQLFPAHHALMPVLWPPFDSFRKGFPPILILLLRGTSKNEGIPEGFSSSPWIGG